MVVWERVIWSVFGDMGACYMVCVWWCGRVLYGLCEVVWERVIWSVCGGVVAWYMECVW